MSNIHSPGCFPPLPLSLAARQMSLLSRPDSVSADRKLWNPRTLAAWVMSMMTQMMKLAVVVAVVVVGTWVYSLHPVLPRPYCVCVHLAADTQLAGTATPPSGENSHRQPGFIDVKTDLRKRYQISRCQNLFFLPRPKTHKPVGLKQISLST